MIFQHSLNAVLNGSKSQTSRIWKPDYVFSWSDYEEPNQIVLSQKAWDAGKIRQLYRVGQVFSVQPNRGQKGVARIRILELAKRDVRTFDYTDIVREGFGASDSPYTWFFNTWISMHDVSLSKEIANKTHVSVIEAIKGRPLEFYQALAIQFVLIDKSS